jgi:hypothetical protein
MSERDDDGGKLVRVPSDTLFVHVRLFPDMTERLSLPSFGCGIESLFCLLPASSAPHVERRAVVTFGRVSVCGRG